MWYYYVLFLVGYPLMGALLGWFTNYLAVKMLFHPKEPITALAFGIGSFRFKGITFQGIFPKRQKQIAMQIGKVVADELLSIDDIKERVVTDEGMENIYTQVEVKMDNFMKGRMVEKFPFLSLLASRKLKMDIRNQMMDEVKVQLPDVMDKYIQHFEDNLDIEAMITEKFSQLSTERLEQVMNDILSKEFKFIEILGGVIGFLVGLIQGALACLMI